MLILGQVPVKTYDTRLFLLAIFISFILVGAIMLIVGFLIEEKIDDKDIFIGTCIAIMLVVLISPFTKRETGYVEYYVKFNSSYDIKLLEEDYIIKGQKEDIYILIDKIPTLEENK